MKLTTHPFKSDLLTITAEELKRIANGEELSVSALYVRLEREPKPDHVYYGVFEMDGSMSLESCFTKLNDSGDELKLTFDGETGKLKSAEVL